MKIDGTACSDVDAYGSNNCAFDWGATYTGQATLNSTQDIIAGSKLVVDTKVDRLLPFKFECDACGADCTVTVPVISKTVTFTLPPCPLKALQIAQAFNFSLPADSPVPAKTTVKGTVAINDPSGAKIVGLTIDVSAQ